MGDVFDRWRINNGWNPWDNDTQDMAIASWCHSLDKAEIPFELYGELYDRCLAMRAAAMTNGEQIPNFGVELMLATWPALREELKQREIAKGRTLTANAETLCPKCHGTGIESIEKDGKFFSRPGCKHDAAPEETEYRDGIDRVIAANKVGGLSVKAETLQILKNARLAIVRAGFDSNGQIGMDAFDATAKLLNVERYVKDQEEEIG